MKHSFFNSNPVLFDDLETLRDRTDEVRLTYHDLPGWASALTNIITIN